MPLITDESRALATVETITAMNPIDGADSIMAAQVRGWTVVVRSDEFTVGDRVVFFEIDTALPISDPRYAFLEPRGSRDVDGRLFHVLRTAKLRGTYSQGLVLPLDLFSYELAEHMAADGCNITGALDLSKWETPIPNGGEGLQAGPFLHAYATKTDSERAQNLGSEWPQIATHDWVATEKVDGTSCTIIRDETGQLRVCGRNWEISEGDNLYWRAARTLDLADMLDGDVLQVEIVGDGIQGNRLGLPDQRPLVFAYARGRTHLPRNQWPAWALANATPVHPLTFPSSPADAVAQVDGIKSLVTPGRLAEGIVWHTADGTLVPQLGRTTLKVVSPKYLLKG